MELRFTGKSSVLIHVFEILGICLSLRVRACYAMSNVTNTTPLTFLLIFRSLLKNNIDIQRVSAARLVYHVQTTKVFQSVWNEEMHFR